MISANELRNRKFSPEQNGYNVDEVSTALNEAADTIDGYVNRSVKNRRGKFSSRKNC